MTSRAATLSHWATCLCVITVLLIMPAGCGRKQLRLPCLERRWPRSEHLPLAPSPGAFLFVAGHGAAGIPFSLQPGSAICGPKASASAAALAPSADSAGAAGRASWIAALPARPCVVR